MSKRILILLSAILLLLIAGAALAWFAPLGGAPLPQQTASFNPAAFAPQPAAPDPTPTTAPALAADPQVEEGVEIVEVEVSAPIAEQPELPVCKGPASMAVLVLGIDENAQADAIRLVPFIQSVKEDGSW